MRLSTNPPFGRDSVDNLAAAAGSPPGRRTAAVASGQRTAPHPPGEVARDRQTEAGPRDAFVAGEPMEPLEDAASLVCRDAVAVVADDEQGDEPVRDSGDLDVAATGRELQGVRDEVREHLLDPATIARRDAEARRQRGRETDLPADRDRQERGRDLAAGLGDRERPELEIDGARLDPGDLQQVAD